MRGADLSENEYGMDQGVPGLLSSWAWILAAAVGAVVASAVALVMGYQIVYADRVYPGVRVLGVDLGGLTPEGARAALFARVSEAVRQPVVLTYGDRQWQMSWQELGFGADVDSLVDTAFSVGRQGGPLERLSLQMSLARDGRSFEGLRPKANEQALRQALQRLTSEIDRPVREARLLINPDLKIHYTSSQTGLSLDMEETARRIREHVAEWSTSPIPLAVRETHPVSRDEHLAEARDRAEKILASPVVLEFQGQEWRLEPEQLYELITTSGGRGQKLELSLDRAKLEKIVKQIAGEINQAPQDAKFQWAGGQLEVIRPSRNGQELDVEATVGLILSRAPTNDHRIALPVTITPPAVSADDSQKLGIRELIKQSRTRVVGVPEKQHNIRLAASRINGTVVPPGAIFSFNKALGPTTLESGYQVGWGITTSGQEMKTVPSVAGGICQVATTLFHAVFWAGYPIEERNWHLYWIDAYGQPPLGMKGLDATVDEEYGLDFKFINATDSYLLIQSWVDKSNDLYFALYGTKPTWEVKVQGPVITNVVPANREMVEEEEPSMPEGKRLQVEAAQDGFDATIIRTVTSGDDVRTLRLQSHYRPSRNVTLVGTGGKPPKPKEQKQQPGPEEQSPS